MDIFKLVGSIVVNNEEANKAIDNTTTKASGLSGILSGIGGMTVKFGTNMAKYGGMIGGAWLAGIEGSRDYRTEMGKLDAAYTTAGYSAETAMNAYKQLYGVIGETDQAVEAAQQIALLADSEKEVMEWSELAAGVVGRFGDALQPETFFESANETMKLCEATGAYVQMLEGVGMSVDDFNAGLASCSTESERQAYMLDVTRRALGEASKTYSENNKDIIEANKAHDGLTQTMGKLGEMGEPILTQLINGVNKLATEALPYLQSALEWMKENGEVTKAAILGIAAAMAVAAATAHPYAAAVLAIVSALGLMKARNADGDAYNHWFDQYTDEDLARLQRYVDAVNETRALYAQLEQNPFDEEAGMRLQAAEAAKEAAFEEANAIEGLIATYEAWRSGQAENTGKDLYLDVPTRLAEDSEGSLQGELDGLSLEADAMVYGNYSAMYSEIASLGLTAYADVIPTSSAGVSVDGSHAGGLDFVPRDGYIARLHYGEQVLTRSQADARRSGQMGNTGRLESMMSQLISLTQQMVANTAGGKQVVLDSGVLVGQLAPALDVQLGTISGRKGRRA